VRARKILEEALGPDAAQLATVFESLSQVYEERGKTIEAKEFAARAHKIRKPEQMRKPQNN
jgi:hypothetical protein